MKKWLMGTAMALAFWPAGLMRADSIGASFSASYTFTEFQTPAILSKLGGLVVDPNNPNVLLIGANSSTSSGTIYSVGLTRDSVTNQITGFSGSPTLYALAPDIDGGLTFAPNQDLLFTQYADNTVGELKPGSSSPDKTTASSLPSLEASTGGMTFIPTGFGGAGNAVFTSYNHSIVCATTATPDGQGTYTFGSCSSTANIGGTLEGILYVPAGTGGFSTATVLIERGTGAGVTVNAYQTDSNGLPILAIATVFFTGSANEGLALDPITNDILMTNYNQGTNGGTIYVVSSTAPEPGTMAFVAIGVLLGVPRFRKFNSGGSLRQLKS